MALWGTNDNVSSVGQVWLNYTTGIVTAIGSSFGQVGFAKTGDVIRFGTRGGGTYYGDAVIVGIASTTQLTIGSTAGLSGAAIAGVQYYISELPLYSVGDITYSNTLDSSPVLQNNGVTGAAYTNAGVGTNRIPVRVGNLDVIVGDTVLNGGTDVRITAIGVTNITVGSGITVGIATGATLLFKRYSGGYDKQVYGISTTTVGSAYTTTGLGAQYHTSHAGWVGVQTYIDMHGNLRVKTEVLVAGSGIQTGANGIAYPTNV